MKLNVLLSVTAVYLALLGLGFIFAPLTIGAGAVPADARPSLIAFRADTSLALISDSEFQEGQAAIELAAARSTRPLPLSNGSSCSCSRTIESDAFLSGVKIPPDVTPHLTVFLRKGPC